MSLCHQTYRRCAVLTLILAVVLVALPALLNAQSAQSNDAVPKEELFVGYQWFNPGGNIPVGNPPVTFQLPSNGKGAGVSLSFNLDRAWAFETDWGTNQNDNGGISTGMFGPKVTFRGDGVNFFFHGLVGIERLKPEGAASHTNIAGAVGGGMDLKLWKSISLRLFQVDYVPSHQNFSDVVAIDEDPKLRHSGFNSVRLRTGVVFNIGGAPEVPVTAACSVQNAQVMVGEPVHVSVAASNFNPKHTLSYAWSSNGGKIEGKDTGANIDTNGIAGGSYTATATVTDAKSKKNNVASCTGNFTVKEPPKNPPQISCSANPTTVQAGTSAAITCSCTSPDNVPVTVGGWSASGGSISGSGNSATLSTAGASSGPITINATCTDSRGLTASASSTVTIDNPPPPPPPQATKLNECEYPNLNKPWRVDNTCKAMLDDVAGKLQQDPDAKLVVVGNSTPKEKRKNLAGERAVDVKAYLSGGEAKQNIDPSRIETRTGAAGTMTSEQWIIPAGATFPGAGSTTPVDEKKVKAIPDHPKPAAKKAAKKKAE